MQKLVAVVVLVAALAAVGGARPPAAAQDPGVLIIGDSVATGMSWNDAAIAVVQKNLAVKWDIAICRTVAGVSCPFDGARPPTLVDAVAARGQMPAIVVVVTGYNDPAPTFAESVDEAMTALTAAGAQHVLWLTLRAARPPYAALNTILRSAAAKWPQLELLDWDGYSAPHPPWFQTDGVHLLSEGGVAMAHFIHGAILAIVDPLRVVTPLRLRDGRSLSIRLRARGGTPPYVWRVGSGRPPGGFHLRADGLVVALPRTTASFSVIVTDADGVTAREQATAR
jgi:hypothetical protein